MKLKEYIKKLKEIEKDHPNADVICAADEEGNRFSPVVYSPSAGHFDGIMFDSSDETEDVNAVCVN
jgi:hypothetical protein